MGTRSLLSSTAHWLLALLVIAAIASGVAHASEPDEKPAWAHRLERNLLALDQVHSGELGVYVKDLSSGTSVSLRADESWYLASGIKVPVAIAILRDVELGKIALDTKIKLLESDYVDGAGKTNWHKPGSPLAIRYLLEQMLTVSDNTASDVLIRAVGLEHVNGLIQELVPKGFGAVTTLADVRRHTYSGFHPDAFNLTGKDFLVIRKQTDEHLRLKALAGVLGVDADDFNMPDLDSAFAAYYATNLNGGQLSAYGALLETLFNGHALRPESTDYLLNVLFNVETGKSRVKAGLPPSVAFAHKTGTQHGRACDLGVAMGRAEVEERARAVAERAETAKVVNLDVEPSRVGGPQASSPRVVIAACSRGFQSVSGAEAALRAVGEAVSQSGVLSSMITNTAQTGDSHERVYH